MGLDSPLLSEGCAELLLMNAPPMTRLVSGYGDVDRGQQDFPKEVDAGDLLSERALKDVE